MADDDRLVLLRLAALGRVSDAEWDHGGAAVLLDEWLDLTKRSSFLPIVQRLIAEDEERRKP
jgi:hypothetical protein